MQQTRLREVMFMKQFESGGKMLQDFSTPTHRASYAPVRRRQAVSTRARQRFLWLGLAMLLCAVACTNGKSKEDRLQGSPPPRPRSSAEEIGAMFEKPTTVGQLLQNLKIAADRHLLSQPGFGTDANLLKFFDGVSVR